MKPWHTPLPWKVSWTAEYESCFKTQIVPANGMEAVCYAWHPVKSICHDNAAFIVRAVNCHEELLQALKAMTKRWENVPEEKRYQYSECVQSALKTIAKAEGK